MFYEVSFVRNLRILPQHLGPKLYSILERTVRSDLEGTFTPEYGFVVAVTSIQQAGRARIDDATIFTHFPCIVTAVCFRPLRNEILEGIVKSVSTIALIVSVATIDVFVARPWIDKAYSFDDSTGIPRFVVQGDEELRLAPGDKVRLKVMSATPEPTGMTVQGRMDGHHAFGRIED
nr:RNA polymerase II subunit RPB7 [Andalucia godoyi]